MSATFFRLASASFIHTGVSGSESLTELDGSMRDLRKRLSAIHGGVSASVSTVSSVVVVEEVLVITDVLTVDFNCEDWIHHRTIEKVFLEKSLPPNTVGDYL